MLKKATILLSLTIFLITKIQAQQPTDKIVFGSFNQSYFKERLLEKLNVLRDSLKAPRLEVDNFLEQPADLHAKYLVKTSQVTNAEEGKLPLVEDRVNSFKGNYGTLGQISAAANVGKSTFLKKENKKVIYETYEDVLNGIVKDIANYSSNKKGLENANLSNVGIALGIDEPGKRIYAVFVLGNKPYKAPSGIKVTENAFGVKFDEGDKCANAKSILKKIPATVGHGAYIENGQIYYYMENDIWFNKLFEESIDAISVDLIHKDQYACDGSNIQHKSPLHDGIMLPLVKKKTLIKGNKLSKENKVLAVIGKVPAGINAEEYEANVIYIKSKCECGYIKKDAFKPDSFKLLHMGLFVDTINPDNEVYMEVNPNKIKYSFSANSVNDFKTEIEALNKSLGQGRKFDFKKIDIISYYPFNAPADKSIENCTSIANTFIYKLQQSQKDTIVTTNTISPRWLEFYKTILGTKFDYLKTVPRAEILNKLSNMPDLSNQLSSVFTAPYKFELTMEIQIEKLPINVPFSELKSKIDEAVTKESYQDVSNLLKTCYNELHHNVIDKKDLASIQIPRKAEFIESLISFEAIKYLYGINDASYAYDEFTRINNIVPGNKKVLYNMAVLNILKCYDGKEKLKTFDPAFADIQNLTSYDLDKSLIHKLNANYFFLKGYKEHRNNQLKSRESALKSASTFCIGDELNNSNLETTLNNYSFYSSNDLIPLLADKTVVLDNIDRSIVFSYLKNTIQNISTIDPKTFWLALENAYNISPEETCSLFNSEKGSFQLKDNKLLKDFVCSHCSK
jgi:hypothetical protein